jgi:CelD/BcsL family acetyltransferase involved in cellulose biosynthesis
VRAKRDQYLRTLGQDWLADPKRRRLLEALAEVREPECTAVISTLRFGETWAAIHLGLKSLETLHYWLPVYNPELKTYAPGRLLLREIINHAADREGIRAIDRGVGESEAKHDFPSRKRLYSSGDWHLTNAASFAFRATRTAHRLLGPLIGRLSPSNQTSST